MSQANEVQSSSRLKVFATIFFMGAGYALAYALPFIQYMFYDPMLNSIGATNAQLGTLIAIFGLGNVFGAPIGGWVADKFNHKTVYLVSLVGNAVLCFIFAYNLSYRVAIFIWLGSAVASLFGIFPSHVKIVRLLGSDEEQGKIFGLTEAAGGVGSIIVNAVAVFLFARAASEVGGFKLVVIGYGVFSLIVAAILYFLIDGPKEVESGTSTEDAINLGDFVTVLKNRGTWHTGFSIFAVYTLYVSLSYFTPYSTSVLGVTASAAGLIAIARTYVIRIFGSPLGGLVGDKMGSVSKAIIIACIGAIGSIIGIMLVPAGTVMYVVITLTLLLSVFTYIGRANMFAVQSEVKIPPKYAATAAGITCGIGFFPDFYQFILFGNWLDKYGDAGYNYIFIYTIVILALGIVNSIFAIKYKNSLEAKAELN